MRHEKKRNSPLSAGYVYLELRKDIFCLLNEQNTAAESYRGSIATKHGEAFGRRLSEHKEDTKDSPDKKNLAEAKGTSSHPNRFVEDNQELTKEEQRAIIHTKDFQDFFDSTSKMVERALGQENDILPAFLIGGDDNADK